MNDELNDVVRSLSENNERVIDESLKVTKAFFLPSVTTPALNGAKDEVGFLLVTSDGKVHAHIGANVWQQFATIDQLPNNIDLLYSAIPPTAQLGKANDFLIQNGGKFYQKDIGNAVWNLKGIIDNFDALKANSFKFNGTVPGGSATDKVLVIDSAGNMKQISQANIVPGENSSGTGSGNSRGDIFTAIGDGATLVYEILHGLSIEPEYVLVGPANEAAKGIIYCTKDATKIYVHYDYGTPEGEELQIFWIVPISSTIGGKFIGIGDGIKNIYTIPHGMSKAPNYLFVGAGNDNAKNIQFWTKDATNIYVHYDNAHAFGEILEIYWTVNISIQSANLVDQTLLNQRLRTIQQLSTSSSPCNYDVNIAMKAKLTMDKNLNLIYQNLQSGDEGKLYIYQNNIGGHILTLPAGSKFKTATSSINTTPNSQTYIEWESDGTKLIFTIIHLS